VDVWCCCEKCEGVSGGLVWGKKCAAILLGRTEHDLQELCTEVAPRAAGKNCVSGTDRPHVCERRSMCAGVQRPRSRESVLFIGTQFSILYISMHSPPEAGTQKCSGA
jgi:hypothetical protein